MNAHPCPAPERLAPGAALDFLRDAEWNHPSWGDVCPICEQTKRLGHRVDCLIAHAIIALAPIRQPPDLVSL